MTAIPQSASSRLVSDRLTAPLRRVAQRQWYVLAAVGVLKTLIVSLIAILSTALLLGYFQNLWMPVRVLLALITWALVIGSAIRFLRPVLGRWSLSRAAMQIEQQQPGLHERLSSAVELSAETDPAFRGSPSLIAHLMRQAEGDAVAVKPELVVSTDRIVRWALLFAPVLLAWLTVALIPSTTKTAMAGLYRVLMPWTDALPALLNQVVVKPGDVTLVQGDLIDISAHVSFDSASNREVRHATLVRKFENGQRLTDDMEMAGPRDYRIHFDDLQQTFSYMIATDQGDSSWFKAIVHPRPQISNIDVRCDYPAYSGISATVASSREGGIEALVGTRVTLTIHTELPVVAEKSQVVIDEGTPDQLVLPLKQVAAGKSDYQVQLIVNHSGEYRINLSNEFDLTNKDEQPRSIVAQPDEVPTIVINSPEPQVTVRPDDTVPVKYIAADDFAVAKIEAIVQADEQPAQTIPVTFKTKDKRTVTGPAFLLSVADVLKVKGLKAATHITYQLKVTDNRDPDPQFSFSTKQTLKINKDEYQSFQAKEERKIAQDLTRAIEKAIAELNREQQQIQVAKDADAKQTLEEYHHKNLHLATQEIPKTSRALAKAADEAMDSVFQETARTLKKIATKPIRAAAEDATQADLNFENGQDRKDAATKSIAEIIDARDQLQKLLDKQEIAKDEQKAEAARDLADAAKKQQEAADALKAEAKANQQKDPQASKQQQNTAAHKQEQANQKLQQALQQAEALRDPKAQETAQKLEDLIKKVEEAQKQQDAAAEQTEKQQDANDIQQKANELAKKQEELNKDIEKSADQNKDALQKANAQTPNKDQQNDIVKNLDKNNLQQAHEQMKQAANQLHQEAKQLENQAKSNDLHPNQKQQDAQNKDQQAAQNAQNEQNQAQQAANDLKQEAQQNATPKADDNAVKNAKQAAKEIEKQAADLHPQNADAKQKADAAQQDAKAAEKAADQAAQAANPEEAKKDLNDAAQDLNKAAGELADAAKENAAADKADMVKDQQKDSQAAADQANKQADAQDALAKAVEAQQADLAKAQQNQQPPDQAAQQQNQVADQAKAAAEQAKDLQKQAQDAKNPDVANRAEAAKADLADAQQHAAEAAKAEQQAAQAQQDAANAPNAEAAKGAEQKADTALEQAANHQQQAQDALAKAENELRNLPQDAQANAQQPTPDATAPQADANAQGQPADAQAGMPDATQQAAQKAQEAAQAQQEASQQNPAAAQQAANALAQAAQAMAKTVPGLQPGQEPGQEPGNEPGQDPSATPGQTPDSKQGISAASAPISLPASVRDIGITADQWATLPPLAKKDLMNAAQQNGPPSYRQMIKDYYVRIAKIQQTGGPVGQ
jgi:DNA segregation ATPase FtsK/SpoIIIE-like protein